MAVANRLALSDEPSSRRAAKTRGATHSSFHTTISVLEGLRPYEIHRRRKVRAVRAAQRGGREFLLEHRLFRSHRTGDIIKPIFLRLSFPPRWHYDILQALRVLKWWEGSRDGTRYEHGRAAIGLHSTRNFKPAIAAQGKIVRAR